MSLKVRPLSYKAKENCTLVIAGEFTLILDAGIKKTQMPNLLAREEATSILATLITHEHVDHVAGAVDESKTYATPGTIASMGWSMTTPISTDQWFKIGPFKVKAIPAIHDAAEPCVFVIKHKEGKVLYFADSEYFEHKDFKKTTHFAVEANYGATLDPRKEQAWKAGEGLANHMTLKQAEALVLKYKAKHIEAVEFIHISSGNPDGDKTAKELSKRLLSM